MINRRGWQQRPRSGDPVTLALPLCAILGHRMHRTLDETDVHVLREVGYGKRISDAPVGLEPAGLGSGLGSARQAEVRQTLGPKRESGINQTPGQGLYRPLGSPPARPTHGGLCVEPCSSPGPEWTRLPLGGPQFGINFGINFAGAQVVPRAANGVGRAVHGADGSRTDGRSRATGVRWRHGHADGVAGEVARPRRARKVDVTRAVSPTTCAGATHWLRRRPIEGSTAKAGHKRSTDVARTWLHGPRRRRGCARRGRVRV